jgi:hypothetical protein
MKITQIIPAVGWAAISLNDRKREPLVAFAFVEDDNGVRSIQGLVTSDSGIEDLDLVLRFATDFPATLVGSNSS